MLPRLNLCWIHGCHFKNMLKYITNLSSVICFGILWRWICSPYLHVLYSGNISPSFEAGPCSKFSLFSFYRWTVLKWTVHIFSDNPASHSWSWISMCKIEREVTHARSRIQRVARVCTIILDLFCREVLCLTSLALVLNKRAEIAMHHELLLCQLLYIVCAVWLDMMFLSIRYTPRTYLHDSQ